MDSLFFLFSIINFDNFEQTNVFANAQKRKVRPFDQALVDEIGLVRSVDALQKASDAIFFHMHGGGFIAQTSKSHQSYLRQWSRNLNIPIFSVDYSLAPQAPFPR